MTTKPTTTPNPEELREQAEELNRQAAEATAALQRAKAEENDKRWQQMLTADREAIAAYNPKAIDQTVEEARLKVEQAVAEMPVTRALADLIDKGPAAWKDVNPTLLGLGSIHRDLRVAYRKAVAAGAIRDDRGADSYRPPLTYDRDRPLG